MELYGLTLEKLGFRKESIDKNLNFDDHVFTLYKKDGRKLLALSRISNYMSFAESLTWMFHSRKANSKINNIHGRTLRKKDTKER